MMDAGHRETDELLDKIEKRVAREYRQASEEAQKKLDDYLRRFEIKDKKWQQRVADGTKTQAEYREWRKGQIMMGKRWEEMCDTLAQDYHNANKIARSIVDGYKPEVYALNHNYATFQVEHDAMVDTSYTLYNRETVERILRDDPDILPTKIGKRTQKELSEALAAGKDLRWQAGQIQSVTLQSILQGESIPNMAKRIARTMGETNHASTIRYARTAMTGAENAGRQAAYERAAGMGLVMQKQWIATLDGRTRHEHRILDGQTRPVDEPYEVDGEKIMYPGDPTAEGALIWNCRCTQITQFKGFERDPADLGLRNDDKLGDMTYDEWKHEHEKPVQITTSNIPSNNVSPVPVSRVSADSFVPALDRAKASCPVDKAWRVDTTRTADDFRNDRITTYITKNGSTFALKDDGDIISVCKNQLTDKDTNARSLLAAAVEAGGTHLDSFDGNYGFYVRCGFEPVSRCKFSKEFAPPGWVEGRDKEEDIYFMRYVGIDKVKLNTVELARENIPYSNDYDIAESIVKSMVRRK